MIWIITSIVALLSSLFLFLIWNFNYWNKRSVPGPQPTPLLGNIPSMITQKKALPYEFDDIYKKYKSKVPFLGFFNIREPQVLLMDTQLIKDVLITNFKNFHDNEFSDMVDKKSDPIFSRNPFMLSGEAWKEKRAEITPAFTNARIKAMIPLMEDVCTKMITYLENEKDEPVEAKELASKYTTDVVSSCIFAMDAQSFTQEKAVIREMGRELMTPTAKLILYMIFSSMFPFMRSMVKMSFIPKHLEVFFTELMRDAVKHRTDNNVQRADYLEHLMNLKSKKGLSVLDMAAHGVTFFLDGFETSSVAISFALYEIAKNKSIQERLRTEAQNAVDENGQISYEALVELPYLDQVIHETLRLWPPASYISKKCTEPINFQLSKDKEVLIEKNMVCGIPIWSIHRDPENYENPECFDPDRFSEENGGIKRYKDKGCFYSFGDGPRICLGMRFAVAQMKRGLFETVRNFEMSVNSKTVEPVQLDPKQFLSMPLGGLWLNFKSIKGN